MAIQYRLLQNKIKGSKNYNKYYAHTMSAAYTEACSTAAKPNHIINNRQNLWQ